jgi:hypothetical protein
MAGCFFDLAFAFFGRTFYMFAVHRSPRLN